MRFLLWNLVVDRTYSFYIETSIDNKNWDLAVDKRNEPLQSWQEFTFECRPVSFIKIVGTYSSGANTGFALIHFEAPCLLER